MQNYFRSIAALVLLMLAGIAGHAQGASATFTYTGPEGVTFTVTPAGLSSIHLGEKEVASGGWHTMNAEWMFKAGAGKVVAGAVKEKTLEILAPDHARVRQVQQDVVTTFDYTFSGEDVTIKARVENNHPSEDLGVVGFQGLQFKFSKPPHGIMLGWHVSYLQHVGLAICHPGFYARIGGSYGTDSVYGVGVSPWQTGITRTFIQWDRNWGIQDGEKDLGPRMLGYYVPSAVPAGGARSYTLKLRVSANTDWKHLLQPYKDHFLATYGPVKYTVDRRPIAQSCVNKNVESIGPNNPYGFHDGARRLDLAEGVKALIDWQIPALKAANGQGVIFWGQGGEDPRGAMYRPDFDILPPAVEENWKTLRKAFDDAGLRLGVAARPGEIAYRMNWKQDGTLLINPDDPAHLEMMWRRFKHMMDLGCTMFYLDTFGTSLEDVKAMRYYREKMGPGIQTFVEMHCDAMLPYTGVYLHTRYDKGFSVMWIDLHTWDVFRWLCPGVGSAAKLDVYPLPKDVAPGAQYRWLYQHDMTPLENDYMLQNGAKSLNALQAEFIDAQGQWKQ